MKKFYKILEDFPARFDQTSDNANNMRGLAPETYRSPQVDEEEMKSETMHLKDAIKKVIEGLEGKESLDKNEITNVLSMLRSINNKI